MRCAINTIPLFPLSTIIFPEGVLPMRIFEPRYVDMVGECMREDKGFGICLLKEGSEVGENRHFYSSGTYVKIIDFDRLEDGLLGIVVKGERRFKVLSASQTNNHLNQGEVAWLSEEEQRAIPDKFQSFSDLLLALDQRYELPFEIKTDKINQASWVSCRLAELLPFDKVSKQHLLEIDDAVQRFKYMHELLEKMNLDENSLFQV